MQSLTICLQNILKWQFFNNQFLLLPWQPDQIATFLNLDKPNCIKLWQMTKFNDNLLSSSFDINRELILRSLFALKIYNRIYSYTKTWNTIAYWWYLILRPYIIHITTYLVAIWSKVLLILGMALSLFCQMFMEQNKAAHVIGRISSLRFNINRQQNWKNGFNFRTAFNWKNLFYLNEVWKISVYVFKTVYICCEFVLILFSIYLILLLAKHYTLDIFGGGLNKRSGSKIQAKS